jgi:hypothetical protein
VFEADAVSHAFAYRALIGLRNQIWVDFDSLGRAAAGSYARL